MKPEQIVKNIEDLFSYFEIQDKINHDVVRQFEKLSSVVMSLAEKVGRLEEGVRHE